jgi:hypothetical protein
VPTISIDRIIILVFVTPVLIAEEINNETVHCHSFGEWIKIFSLESSCLRFGVVLSLQKEVEKKNLVTSYYSNINFPFYWGT